MNTNKPYYDDLPESPIPVDKDYNGYEPKIDVNSSTLKKAVDEYLSFLNVGNISAANDILKSHPEIPKVLVLASDWNNHSQRIAALERFLSEDIDAYMENLQKTIATENGMVVKEDYDHDHHVLEVTIPTAGWLDSTVPGYKYVAIPVNHIYVSRPQWSLIPSNQYVPSDIEIDTYNDIVSMYANTSNLVLWFYSQKVPAVSIKVSVKGVD